MSSEYFKEHYKKLGYTKGVSVPTHVIPSSFKSAFLNQIVSEELAIKLTILGKCA